MTKVRTFPVLISLLFILPLFLFISGEFLFAQIMLLTQFFTIWGVIVFVTKRGINPFPGNSMRNLIMSMIFVSAVVLVFTVNVKQLVGYGDTDSKAIPIPMYGSFSEFLLILGICLSGGFVIGVLYKRRGEA